MGRRQQGVEAVDFFTEVVTVYIDHTSAPSAAGRVYLMRIPDEGRLQTRRHIKAPVGLMRKA